MFTLSLDLLYFFIFNLMDLLLLSNDFLTISIGTILLSGIRPLTIFFAHYYPSVFSLGLNIEGRFTAGFWYETNFVNISNPEPEESSTIKI